MPQMTTNSVTFKNITTIGSVFFVSGLLKGVINVVVEALSEVVKSFISRVCEVRSPCPETSPTENKSVKKPKLNI